MHTLNQSSFRRLVRVFAVFVALSICYIMVINPTLFRSRRPVQYQFRPPINVSVFFNPIKIGFVTCIPNLVEGEDVSNRSTTLKTLTLLKSVLISAKIYGANQIHFHILTNSDSLENFLRRKVAQYNIAMNGSVIANVKFYSIFDTIPKNGPSFVKDLVLMPTLPCSFVRVLVPEALTNVEEMIYLDTDVVITGDITKIWEKFRGLGDKKLAVIMPNNQPEDTHFNGIDSMWFGDIPHVHPKGVNSGIMFMNLAEMRKVNWTIKMLQLHAFWTERGKTHIEDQRLINIYFHDNPSELNVGPCNLNFMHVHCDFEMTCRQADEDPNGILMVHGAGGKFRESSSAFYHLYQSYMNFDLLDHDRIINNLIKPLKIHFANNSNADGESNCGRTFGSLLFKNLFLPI